MAELLENAARAFDPGISQDAGRTTQKVADDRYGNGQLTVESRILTRMASKNTSA